MTCPVTMTIWAMCRAIIRCAMSILEPSSCSSMHPKTVNLARRHVKHRSHTFKKYVSDVFDTHRPTQSKKHTTCHKANAVPCPQSLLEISSPSCAACGDTASAAGIARCCLCIAPEAPWSGLQLGPRRPQQQTPAPAAQSAPIEMPHGGRGGSWSPALLLPAGCVYRPLRAAMGLCTRLASMATLGSRGALLLHLQDLLCSS